MYALCGPKTYGPFVCDLLLHTYAYVDFALMYGWIYVLLDICLLVMVMYCWIYIYICWIYVLLDRCTTVYMLLLLPETSTKKCYMAYKPCTPAIRHLAYKPYSCGELISRVAQHLAPGL